MAETTAKEVMERAQGLFLPEKAQGVDAVIHYQLRGEGGGDWTMTIRGGACQVQAGAPGESRLTLTAEAKDYVDIVMGKLDPMIAFGSGKLKVKGDLGLAMKLMGMFRR